MIRRARPACGLAVAIAMGHALLQPSGALAAPANTPPAPPTPPILVGPIPRSVWLYEPDPAALPSVHARLDEVLDLVNPVNRQLMADSEVRIHVIPQDWNLTDLPPWSNLKGSRLPDPNPYDGYNESRSYDQLRGLGPAYCVSGPLDIAIAEEHIVSLPRGTYSSPAANDVGKILVHEVAHGVDCSLSPPQYAALDKAFAAATARPSTEMVGDAPSYSASTRREYFAEGVVAWFEAAQGPSYRRAWLRDHDPALYSLLTDVFTVPPAVPPCDGKRATTLMRTGAGPATGTPGADVIVGTPEDDIINGGGGDDVVCGEGGNDTIRGGYGKDRIFGGPGDDSLNGGAGDDALNGDAGKDTLVDAIGANRLVGGPADDSLDARDGDESGGPDVVDGSDGIDVCESDADDQVTSCNEPQPAPPPTTATPSTAAPTTAAPTTAAPSTAAPTTPAPRPPTTVAAPVAPTTVAPAPAARPQAPVAPLLPTTTSLPQPMVPARRS